MAGTTTTQSIEVPVGLSLDAAIRQAEVLRRILRESVKPDSSAYRDIENMLNKATRQAQGFKQTMGESLKTSSRTKTFTNNLQKTFNLLDLITERLGNVKGKDLIFSDADAAQIQQINTQISQVNEQIKQLRKEKVGSLFDDNSIPEFKQLQDLAAKLHKNLSDLTFDDLNNAIGKELKNVDNTITNTTEKIKNLDNVLKNTNLSDLNKITQGLRTQGAANTIEVFRADNLTEAAQRLQAFYQQYSDYTGRMKSKIQEGTSVSKVLDDENKAINSNLSTQIAHLNNYRNQLEEALNTLRGISGHKAGQSREYKRGILNSQSMQDLLRSVGFEEEIPTTGDPSGIIMRIREMFTNALNNVQIRAESLTTLRENMLNTLRSVFDGLETEQVVGDNKGFQNSLANWLSGGGVDIKNSGIVQAFNEIKKGSDVTAVINSVAAAVMQYVQSAEQAKIAATEEIQQQNAYAESLRNAQVAVQEGKQVTEDQVRALQEEITVLKKKIELLEKNNEKLLKARTNSDEVDEEAQAYRGLIAQLNTYSGALAKTEAQVRALGNIRTAITNWMGFNQVLNLVKRAVTDAMNHIKQLDATMNGIAIVTDMTTADLWKQVDAYSEMAQKFGVTIQGAYEVSKIYYQAGYDTNEVLTLTNETLKLSKISGLDYATTTDYMMTAMRGFKLEMEDASRVVDVYSNLAANTAVSQQELAEAMTRTASSMESVGATFEETSAMIATMVAVTRESASNIGSAMKSIASRYGELTKDPAALFDADGEAMSFNKVDTALRSVGITLQTTDHQFRDFTEVIIELAEKWNTLDSAAQRYYLVA